MSVFWRASAIKYPVAGTACEENCDVCEGKGSTIWMRGLDNVRKIIFSHYAQLADDLEYECARRQLERFGAPRCVLYALDNIRPGRKAGPPPAACEHRPKRSSSWPPGDKEESDWPLRIDWLYYVGANPPTRRPAIQAPSRRWGRGRVPEIDEVLEMEKKANESLGVFFFDSISDAMWHCGRARRYEKLLYPDETWEKHTHDSKLCAGNLCEISWHKYGVRPLYPLRRQTLSGARIGPSKIYHNGRLYRIIELSGHRFVLCSCVGASDWSRELLPQERYSNSVVEQSVEFQHVVREILPHSLETLDERRPFKKPAAHAPFVTAFVDDFITRDRCCAAARDAFSYGEFLERCVAELKRDFLLENRAVRPARLESNDIFQLARCRVKDLVSPSEWMEDGLK